jgi:hypothetical protein
MLKRCIRCSREAELSIAHVISTIGVGPRIQKPSTVVLFCHRCMHDLLDAGANLLPEDIRESVNNAYTRINRPSTPSVEPE